MPREKMIDHEDYISGARDAVLGALDEYVRELTGCDTAQGWRDYDLPALLPAIDAHMSRLAARINDPDSEEIGSAHLGIRAPR